MEFLDVVQNTLILSLVPGSTLLRRNNDLRQSPAVSCNQQNYYVVECNLSLNLVSILFNVQCCL